MKWVARPSAAAGFDRDEVKVVVRYPAERVGYALWDVTSSPLATRGRYAAFCSAVLVFAMLYSPTTQARQTSSALETS